MSKEKSKPKKKIRTDLQKTTRGSRTATRNANGLNHRQQKFVNIYIRNGFERAAFCAAEAGFSPASASAIAHRLLNTPRIAELVEEAHQRELKQYDVSKDSVIAGLASLGYSNMQDYTRVTDDGSAVVDLTNVTRRQAAAITEITSEVYTERNGEDSDRVKRTKLKLADKRAPLELLGKHVGVFAEDNKAPRQIKIQVKYQDDSKTLGVSVEDSDNVIEGKLLSDGKEVA